MPFGSVLVMFALFQPTQHGKSSKVMELDSTAKATDYRLIIIELLVYII